MGDVLLFVCGYLTSMLILLAVASSANKEQNKAKSETET
jgi:hypothetical protein